MSLTLTMNKDVFTEKEEEFVNLLKKIGIRKTVVQTLVFLANTPEVTSRELERGTDMRQPEVSIAIKYLDAQGWIQCRKVPSERKGRPQKCYSLTKPVKDIIAAIEKARKNEANNQLALVRKIRDYL